MSEELSTYHLDRKTYVKVLDKFPKVNEFHYEGTYTPLDTNKILVLNKNQL